MATAKLSCKEVSVMVDVGMLKSGDVRKLRHHGAISGECLREIENRIIRKITMNGRRRKR